MEVGNHSITGKEAPRCAILTESRFREQVDFLRRQFLQDGDLPFTDVLTEEVIAQALAALSGWLDRIFSPLVTLWVFLGQVLERRPLLPRRRRPPDRPPPGAGAAAVLRPDRRLLPGPPAPARVVLRRRGLLRRPRAWTPRPSRRWLWKGRRVYLFDGTTVTMPDTPENQAAYPQVYNQKPGLGFPIARLGAVISLACGAVVNLGFCRYAGKGQGEVSLLRRLWDVLRPGDVLLADRLIANWATIVLLQRARRRTGQPPEQGPPQGGLPPRAAAGPRRPPRPLGQADVDPVAGPAGVPRAARRRSRFARRGSGSDSRGSGPGRSWW